MKPKRWICAILVLIMALSPLSAFALPATAQEGMPSAITATATDTDSDIPQAYSISSLEELIYAAAHPSYYGKGDTLCLTADLDIRQYNGDFAQDFLNFTPEDDFGTDLLADFHGMGHTIYYYTESLPFINGRANGVIRDLTFQYANVTAGATQSAILARTTELGIIFDNVHILDSTLSTQNDSYCGALIAFAQNNNKQVIIRNCSVVNTHVSTSHTGSTLGIGLLMGLYRTGSTLFVYNTLAADSTVSGINASSYGAGLLVGEVALKAHNEKSTYALFKNVAVLNCALKNYRTTSYAHAIFSVARSGAAITAQNLYALGNKCPSQAGSDNPDKSLSCMFYSLSSGTVSASDYKVDTGVTNLTQKTATPTGNRTTNYTVSAVLDDLNRADDANYLKWTLKNNRPTTESNAPAHYLAGDVNDDGKINNLDALTMLRLLAGLPYGQSINEKAMFLDGDYTVTMADAVLLMKKAQGQNVTLYPAPANATVGKTDDGTYYFENYTLRLISQNVFHGGSSYRIENGVDMHKTDYRKERQRIIMQECGYDPDIIILQEYRHNTWFTQYENIIFPALEFDNHIVSRADPARDTTSEALALGNASGGHTYATAYQPDERLAIFWRKDKYCVATDETGAPIKGMFYFSDTPDVNSPSFGTENDVLTKDGNGVYTDNRNRICVWVKLRSLETGEEVYIYDFHFPNGMDEPEDLKAVNLVHNKVTANCARYGDADVVLGGDMNTNYFQDYDAAAIAEMGKYFDDVGELMGDLQGTFPRFSRNMTPEGRITARIDYFYVRSNETLPLEYKVIDETFDANYNVLENFGGYNPNGSTSKDNIFLGYWASDHAGLFGKFLLKAPATAAQVHDPVSPTTVGQAATAPVGITITNNRTFQIGETLNASVYLIRNSAIGALPLTIDYDPQVLRLVQAAPTTVMPCDVQEDYFAFYNTENVNISGVLLNLEFEVIGQSSRQQEVIAASFAPQNGFSAVHYDQSGTSVALQYNNPSVQAGFRIAAQYGDVDGNGTVEPTDVTLILRHTVGIDTPEMTRPEMGELDGKAGLSVVDAQMILWYLANPGSVLTPV
ncbi:MAG: hypothetical protein IJD09_03110 [Clostridia bacterium]|nr:hypothetical protein [Clostridia bacterium]